MRWLFKVTNPCNIENHWRCTGERRDKEIKRQSVSAVRPNAFFYLGHLWWRAVLQRRQPRPVTALFSCLVLKGQQSINQSDDKEKTCFRMQVYYKLTVSVGIGSNTCRRYIMTNIPLYRDLTWTEEHPVCASLKVHGAFKIIFFWNK